ncbi:MAG: acyl-CoA dehydrogenase family protein, partial [Candidatus Eremiobacteraeota bacterium]|nr:acyl-CoA dehydrogenase family protein [Candidatus Eremiobacteraeota bacterium]
MSTTVSRSDSPAFAAAHDYGTLPRVDYYDIDGMLTPQEREIRDRVRAFVDAEITPNIAEYCERAEFPFHLIDKLRELNLAGGALLGYGCPGMSFLASGLVAAEIARGDGSISTFFGVHSGLAMGAIWL